MKEIKCDYKNNIYIFIPIIYIYNIQFNGKNYKIVIIK